MGRIQVIYFTCTNMASNNTFFSKVITSVASSLGYAVVSKSDQQMVNDSIGRIKAVSLNTSGYGRNNLAEIQKKGINKPGRVSFAMLRQIARADALSRICVNVIKKSVSQCEREIVAKKKAPKKTEEYQEELDNIYELFEFMNANGENMRILLDRILEDLLILDAGAIEKVWSLDGTRLVALNSVDGATIRPVYNEYGELGDPAYLQVVNGKVTAEFGVNDIVYMMANPQNDLDTFGYGLSPIESILLQVQASLEADLYNIKSFTKDNVPPGLLDLGDLTNEQAEEFIATWNATVVTNTQSLKFIWGSDKEKKYIPFNGSNKDMQYAEYIDWLSRVKLAAFGLSGIDANIFQDVNRASAEVQQQLSQSRGVRSTKKLVEEYFTRQIIRPLGEDYKWLEFRFLEAESLGEKKTQAEIDQIRINTGVIDPAEVREREGLSPKEESEDVFSDQVDNAIKEAMAISDLPGDDAITKQKSFHKGLYS